MTVLVVVDGVSRIGLGVSVQYKRCRTRFRLSVPDKESMEDNGIKEDFGAQGGFSGRTPS